LASETAAAVPVVLTIATALPMALGMEEAQSESEQTAKTRRELSSYDSEKNIMYEKMSQYFKRHNFCLPFRINCLLASTRTVYLGGVDAA
jgi:hypothetical protein